MNSRNKDWNMSNIYIPRKKVSPSKKQEGPTKGNHVHNTFCNKKWHHLIWYLNQLILLWKVRKQRETIQPRLRGDNGLGVYNGQHNRLSTPVSRVFCWLLHRYCVSRLLRCCSRGRYCFCSRGKERKIEKNSSCFVNSPFLPRFEQTRFGF